MGQVPCVYLILDSLAIHRQRPGSFGVQTERKWVDRRPETSNQRKGKSDGAPLLPDSFGAVVFADAIVYTVGREAGGDGCHSAVFGETV